MQELDGLVATLVTARDGMDRMAELFVDAHNAITDTRAAVEDVLHYCDYGAVTTAPPMHCLLLFLLDL